MISLEGGSKVDKLGSIDGRTKVGGTVGKPVDLIDEVLDVEAVADEDRIVCTGIRVAIGGLEVLEIDC